MTSRIFEFLKDNQPILTWIGGGIVTVATGLWAVIKFRWNASKRHQPNDTPTPMPPTDTPKQQPTINITADHEGMAAGRDNIRINGIGSSEKALLEPEITYQREINGSLTTFNRRLSSLRISPTGIVKMLDALKAAPSKKSRDALWPSIKSKAESTHTELEHLYSMMATMDRIHLFGKNPRILPHILDDIERVIALKNAGLYDTISSLPSDKSPDPKTIQRLVEQAHALEPTNEKVEAIQHEIADYIDKNEEYVRDLVRSPGSPVKLVLVNA